jgi:hypothetical protein
MMSDKYILEGRNPIACDNLIEWAKWFETADRIVEKTNIGHLYVSTVFLGLDHRFGGRGMPILFETMIFGDGVEDYHERCSTWEQAEEQHKTACSRAKAIIDSE